MDWKRYFYPALFAGVFVLPAVSMLSDVYADEIEVEEISQEIEEPVVEGREEEVPEISVEAHVSNVGWMEPEVIDETQEEILVGTTGKAQSMEAITIEVTDPQYADSIEYRSHVANIGWEQEWVSNGEISGTTGRGYSIEAIQIRLTGELSEQYDIYYQPHVSNVGWLGWAKNGEKAGSAGHGYSLEALRIAFFKKGASNPEVTEDSFFGSDLSSTAHVSNIGWMSPTTEGEITGTVGMANSVEAIQVQLDHPDYDGTIEYQSYVHGIGWEKNWHRDNEMSGTTGQGRYLEAIRFRLTDQMAENYNVYYQTHVANVGWMDWACNGNDAGTIGYDNSIEAVRIMLEKKNSTQEIETGADSFRNNRTRISTHVSNIGWMSPVGENQLAGTTGRGYTMEALTISLNDPDYSGDISYRTYIHSVGWDEWRTKGVMSGTTGQGKYIEAIEIFLTGELADVYDVYYQTHVANVGWLDWTLNGKPSGSTGYDHAIEALRLQLVKKGDSFNFPTGQAYMEDNILKVRGHAGAGWTASGTSGDVVGNYHPLDAVEIRLESNVYDGSVIYKTYSDGDGWQSGWTNSGKISYQKEGIQAIQIALTGQIADIYDIYYQTHFNMLGWLGWAKNGDSSGCQYYDETVNAIRIIMVQKGDRYPVSDKQSYFVVENADDLVVNHAGDVQNGTYYIVDADSGIYYISINDQGSAGVYTFNNTDLKPWTISHDNRGYVIAKQTDEDVYLSAGSTKRSVPKWIFMKDNDGYVIVSQEAVDHHLSVNGDNLINGALLTTSLSVSDKLQHWKLVSSVDLTNQLKELASQSADSLKDGQYEIVNNGNQRIAIGVEQKNSGRVVQMQNLSNSDNQFWLIEHDDQGFATIYSKGEKQYLTVLNNQTIGLSRDGGRIESKWIFLQTQTGYQIVSAANPYADLVMFESKGYAGNTLVSIEVNPSAANEWLLFSKQYSTIRRETLGGSYDMDGWYGAQCWDYVDYVMIHYYGSANGVSCSTTGYVQDIATNKATNGILRFMDDVTGQKMEQGDIIVWGFCDACPYSHIALYDRAGLGDNIYVLGQNQPYPYVNVLSITKEGIIGVFRPKKIYNV